MANLQTTTVTGDLAITGAATGQGCYPLGGIIAVHSQMTGAYSLPSSGAVDANGWQLCDGASIPGSQSLSGTCPNLANGRFIRGNTHANVGVNSGADTHPLVEANLPQHSHTGPNHQHTGPNHQHTGPNHQHTGPNHAHSGPNHAHTWGVNHNVGQNMNTNSGNHAHVAGYIRWLGNGSAWAQMVDGGHPGGPSSHGSGAHGHNFNFSMNVNVGGGTSHSGTGGTAHSGTGGSGNSGTGNCGTGGTSASGGDGTGNCGNYGTGSVTAVPTLPKYMHVVYLMRVK